MRPAHGVMAVLLVGAGLWWLAGHPGYETPAQKLARLEAAEATARRAAEPVLYRWRDSHGVLQVSDKPPKGRKYERIQLRQDQNIVPMTGPAPEPPN